jgi:hypothetical protein
VLTLAADDPRMNDYLAAYADVRSAEVADWLVNTLGKTESAEMRTRILTVLPAMYGPEVVQRLVAHLEAPADDLHAADCARSLAALGTADTCRYLVAQASGTGPSAALCREALAGIKSPYAQESLLEAVSDESLPADVRCAAIAAVAKQPSQRVQTVLVNLERATAVPQVRAAAGQAAQQVAEALKPDAATAAAQNGPGARGELWF